MADDLPTDIAEARRLKWPTGQRLKHRNVQAANLRRHASLGKPFHPIYLSNPSMSREVRMPKTIKQSL
jgi:hypothetical protein